MLSVLALGACIQPLVLGTDCPDRQGVCTDESSSPAQMDADPVDAGAIGDEASAQPADDASDKGADAAPEVLPDLVPDAGRFEMDAGAVARGFLTIQNPDFERNGGIGGDLVVRSLLGQVVPIPPVTIIFADLPGWYACWATTVHSVSQDFDLDAGLMQPQDDYLTFVVNGAPVRQLLATPMQAGTRYALEMDVWGRSDADETLSVEIQGSFHRPDASTTQGCETGTKLGKSGPLPNGAGWTPVCVEFTADRSYTHLLIAPATSRMPPDGGAFLSTARLSLDSLRSVSSCTAPIPAGNGIR